MKLSSAFVLVFWTAATLLAQGLSITTSSPLPNGAEGIPYSQRLAATGASVNASWFLKSGFLPNGLSLSRDGTISGTPTATARYDFEIGLNDGSTTVSKFFSLTIQARLTITTDSPLPPGEVGAFYLKSFESSGPPNVVWSVVSQIPPPGLGVSSTGTLSGTPTTPGTFDFVVQASGGDPVQTATKSFRVVINPALTITTIATLPSAIVSVSYSVQLVSSGGVAPVTWSLLGGALPPGLNLSSSGIISGIPTSPGNFSFVAQVSDSFNPAQQVNRTFGITVNTPVTITTLTVPNAFQNVPYSQPLQAIGTSPFTFAVTSGTLPMGLVLTQAGVLQGTPITQESRSFTVTVTDARGSVGTRNFTLTVDPPLPAFTLPGLPATLNPTNASDVNLSLAAPYPTPLPGTLNLSLTSRAEVPSDDPMTQFSSGTRTVPFTIPANRTTAVLSPPVMLLTGTVAATVRLTVNIDNGPSDLAAATVEIPATAPQITSVRAVRTTGGFDVQVVGYAPSRRVTSADFIFDVRNGSNTQQVTLSKNADADFSNWYRNTASTPFGSSFSFVQSFAVQGDGSLIDAVTVRLTNPQGSTTSSAVRLQ